MDTTHQQENGLLWSEDEDRWSFQHRTAIKYLLLILTNNDLHVSAEYLYHSYWQFVDSFQFLQRDTVNDFKSTYTHILLSLAQIIHINLEYFLCFWKYEI